MVRVAAVAVGLCLLVGACAQGPRVGFCNTYQTTEEFDEAFISKLQENEAGYSFLLTSGPTFGCQKIKFLPNGTYFYDFVDLSNSRVNSSGSYRMKPFSFGNPASITLYSLPLGELGSALGTASFSVLRADEDLLVLISCLNFGLIRTQQLHVLIPESRSASIVAKEVNETIQAAQYPLAGYLREVQQTCAAGARIATILRLLSLYQWLVKLGIIPPVRSTSQEGAFYSGLAAPSNLVLSPQFLQQTHIGAPWGGGSPSVPHVQSFAYPQYVSPQGILNEAQYFSGQQFIPKIQTEIGAQQIQNPIQVYPGVVTTQNTFGLPFTPIQGVASNSLMSDRYVLPLQRPLSPTSPAQPIQFGKQEPGLYNSYYSN